jgi:subtilisin family serine protease
MDYAKLDPMLRLAYREYVENDVKTLRRRAHMLGLLRVDKVVGNSPVLISVECDPAAAFDRLRNEQGVIVADGGCIRKGVSPIKAIPAITDYPGVRYVASSPLLHPKLDEATKEIRLHILRRKSGKTRRDGRGVIIGIVDSGIDAQHPDLIGRIDRIWDQSVRGRGISWVSPSKDFTYGSELTGTQMDSCLDLDGHGTHVAGIAAGARGVAPAAKLVVVKLPPVKIGPQLTDGIDYIFEYAHRCGKSAVVNVSLGSHAGPHDGTGTLSKKVNELVGRGRIVCCAAGNEGKDLIHAKPTLVNDEVAEVELLPVRGDTFVSGWYSPDDDIGVSVESPSGQVTDIEFGQYSAARWVFSDGTVEIERGDWSTRLRNITLAFYSVRPHSFLDRPVLWTIRLHAKSIRNGQVDLWVSDDGDSRLAGPHADSKLTICQPGDADRAVSVGSYTTKNRWVNAAGIPMKSSHEPGSVSEFSSEGPRRDHAHKPDVLAPGAVVESCRSHLALIQAHTATSREYCVMEGTSMATPFVTGAVALMLQSDRDLAPKDVISKLRKLSSLPTPGPTFDPKWGYGLIDLSRM